MILPRVASTDCYMEAVHLHTDRADAIAEAQQQNTIRPAMCYDVFEIEAVKVYDGQEG